MRIYRQAGNIKSALFIGGILLIFGLFVYTQSIIDDLRREGRETVALYARLIAKGVTDADDNELDFVFREIIQKVTFPIIHSDTEGNPVNWRNIGDDQNMDVEVARKLMDEMDSQNKPIPLFVTLEGEAGGDLLEFQLGYLHYGDSVLIRRLRLLPYIEIGAVALFIFLGFSGFQIIRRTEKQHIWFGMAREMAHQLGTPVSSLMGWVERLRDHPKESSQLAADMNTDVMRLQEISERFSRMGSVPKMEPLAVTPLLEELKSYFEKRLPANSREIVLSVESGDETVKASPTLLTWALENLIKNAIDSIDKERGEVKLKSDKDGSHISITVQDNGKGIFRRDWKNIFRPGYTTKERGWGVGLSMVQRIVEDFLSGTIAIKASEVGKGTSIELKLPGTVEKQK
ncbi:MAG: HAMP domain-containing sensor histidine kinase [Candidatus Neomarinimicrobiota bacterium]|nr:HAMP domain-containing sensor histidine kinase [Candidatus Neomarinimicrobiota bacterium]